MSKYTTEVRYICETLAGLSESVGEVDVDRIITVARPKLFDFVYPIFSDEYRKGLEEKILRHFYTREIGLESYGLWKLKLKTKLAEIMPYYNQLYESARLEFNPFYDVDYTKEHDGTNNSTQTNNLTDTTKSEGTNDYINKFSDTPQGDIIGMRGDVNMYLTNATINNAENKDEIETKRTGTVGVDGADKYKDIIKGKIGGADYSTLLKRYRETFMNIDMLVINDLEDLFIQLW